MMVARSMPRLTALRNIGLSVGAFAFWNTHCCVSTAGMLITLTPALPSSVFTRSAGMRSMMSISPERRPAVRVETSGMVRMVAFATFGLPLIQ